MSRYSVESSRESTVGSEAGYRRLWSSVILQAMRDAAGMLENTSLGDNQKRAWVAQARSFFTNPTERYYLACESANIDPEAVRTEVLKRIDDPDAMRTWIKSWGHNSPRRSHHRNGVRPRPESGRVAA